MVLCSIATVRNKSKPLGTDHTLDQDAKPEQKSLVHGRKVNPGIERDEEDLLYKKGRVNEYI